MKQQCNITFVYGSWVILLGGLAFYVIKGEYVQAVFWVVFILLALWAYVRFFPKISRYMGYGSVDDQPAKEVQSADAIVTIYTGVGCPFCPIVKTRLVDLQKRMGFSLKDIDVTLKPDLLISKGIRALPVVEVGNATLVGNATSEQLAKMIMESSIH